MEEPKIKIDDWIKIGVNYELLGDKDIYDVIG